MLERWNPTVKAFTVLICVILLSFEYLVSLNLLVLAVCLLLLMFCSRVSLKKIGVILLQQRVRLIDGGLQRGPGRVVPAQRPCCRRKSSARR